MNTLPEWPLEETYAQIPTHKKTRNMIETKYLLDFIKYFYKNKKVSVKYEYHLFNKKWKNCMTAWQKSCALKIDCVVELSEYTSDIIETDNLLLAETLGQLLVYKYNYEEQTNKKVRYMIALARENQELVEYAMKKHKIKIFIAKNDQFIEI